LGLGYHDQQDIDDPDAEGFGKEMFERRVEKACAGGRFLVSRIWDHGVVSSFTDA
jgi:hypothetical protein